MTPFPELGYRFGYYNKPQGRAALNEFAGRMFPGLDFASWNHLGFEFTEYTPFSYFKDGRVVSNVSASPMTLVIEGERVKAVQIGTVATDPEMRHRGLARALMEKALSHWEGRAAFVFLFADRTAVDFYGRFGFRPPAEHRFLSPAPPFTPSTEGIRKLDLSRPLDRDLLFHSAQNRSPVSRRVGVVDHAWLLLFHAATSFRDQLFSIQSDSVVLIARTAFPKCLIPLRLTIAASLKRAISPGKSP